MCNYQASSERLFKAGGTESMLVWEWCRLFTQWANVSIICVSLFPFGLPNLARRTPTWNSACDKLTANEVAVGVSGCATFAVGLHIWSVNFISCWTVSTKTGLTNGFNQARANAIQTHTLLAKTWQGLRCLRLVELRAAYRSWSRRVSRWIRFIADSPRSSQRNDTERSSFHSSVEK